MRRKATRLAALEQRLAPPESPFTLESRIHTWELEGILAELAAMKKGEPKVVWPKLPPDILPHEREEALAIVARNERELAEFPKLYPEYMAVFEERRNRGETKKSET